MTRRINDCNSLTGLREAARDMVEWSRDLEGDAVAKLDAALSAAGAPTSHRYRAGDIEHSRKSLRAVAFEMTTGTDWLRGCSPNPPYRIIKSTRRHGFNMSMVRPGEMSDNRPLHSTAAVERFQVGAVDPPANSQCGVAPQRLYFVSSVRLRADN